jgi:superfamily II DNA/RNA helicase
VLIATDVAARGIHVDDVTLVVHVDPAADHKDYLHRAGRTARAGERGTVATLVAHNEVRNAERMMRRAGVHAQRSRVAVGDDTLIRITGAQAPSGIPVEVEPEPRPQRRGHRPGAGRDRRPGGGRYGERREGRAGSGGRYGEHRDGEGRPAERQRHEGHAGGPRRDDRPSRRPENRRPRETAQ